MDRVTPYNSWCTSLRGCACDTYRIFHRFLPASISSKERHSSTPSPQHFVRLQVTMASLGGIARVRWSEFFYMVCLHGTVASCCCTEDICPVGFVSHPRAGEILKWKPVERDCRGFIRSCGFLLWCVDGLRGWHSQFGCSLGGHFELLSYFFGDFVSCHVGELHEPCMWVERHGWGWGNRDQRPCCGP